MTKWKKQVKLIFNFSPNFSKMQNICRITCKNKNLHWQKTSWLGVCLFFFYEAGFLWHFWRFGRIWFWQSGNSCWHKDVVKLLLGHSKRFELNARSTFGWTALMYACYYGHEDVINVLLNHSDIDVNARNAYGYTATMIAHKKGHQSSWLNQN